MTTPNASSEQYQDTWLNGEAISKGVRTCEDRYLALKPVLDKYERPFTVLDIGASEGYFSIRIAEDYPNAIVVAAEQNSAMLNTLERIDDMDVSSRIILLSRKLTCDELERLSTCEHFDVVLALNILHHMDGDAGTLLDSVMALGDQVVIETPTPEDIGAIGELQGGKLIEPLWSFCCELEITKLGSFSSHVTEGIERPIFHFGSAASQTRIKTSRTLPFFDSIDETYYTIGSSLATKYFEVEGSQRKWIHGINLRTYQLLGGVWPDKSIVVDLVKQAYRWYGLSNSNHGDIRPWNIILDGTHCHLIDGGVTDSKAIYDDDESLNAVIEEIESGTITRSLNNWCEVGKHSICVLTPFRNARRHLDTYFAQLDELRKLLPYHVRLVAAEGDSEDGTRLALQEYAERYNLDYTLVDTTHGGQYYRSVEDPRRLAMMSGVMNSALDSVKPSDDTVVWIMADVVYEASTLSEMVGAIESGDSNIPTVVAPLALTSNGEHFWDQWAYRKDGKRFNYNPPFTNFNDTGLTEIDSAGTCLIMPGELARTYRTYNNEAVEFCANVRKDGHKIYTHPDWKVYHNYDAPKRALVVGDAPLSTSGYARCIRELLPNLSSKGYEIDLIAIDWPAQLPHNLPYNVFGAQQHSSDSPNGASHMYRMLCSVEYDVLVVLADTFDMASYAKAVKKSREDYPDKGARCSIAWCAVDSGNQVLAPALNIFDHVITWTEWARDELQTRGCTSPIDVVPLGVDTDIFTLENDEARIDARRELILDRNDNYTEDIFNAFIVGFVGRNQPRKDPHSAIASFAKLLERVSARDYDNAYLILHCQGGNSAAGCDIDAVAQRYNITDRIIKYETMLSDYGMAKFYRMCDVVLNTSTGEGFCLPVLEALACGVPVVTPNYGPLAQWAKGNVLQARTIADVVIAPSNTAPYTIGRIVDITDVARCLASIHEGGYDNKVAGRELAEALDSKLVYRHLATRIDQVAQSYRNSQDDTQDVECCHDDVQVAV